MIIDRSIFNGNCSVNSEFQVDLAALGFRLVNRMHCQLLVNLLMGCPKTISLIVGLKSRFHSAFFISGLKPGVSDTVPGL